MGSCVCVCITIDTMLNCAGDVDAGSKCEQKILTKLLLKCEKNSGRQIINYYNI